ncbi:MAG: hypothetical protein HYS04_01245, partial [Acidobacteria bacterium]|nr:hypothetical protein [Acidobacteriota bacterium]
GHQDEDFNNPNLGTCMDYTSNPSSNQHPNQHDYDQLELIYAHLDSTTTVGQAVNTQHSPMMNAAEFRPDQAQLVKSIGRLRIYVQDFGRNESNHRQMVVHYVILAQ